MDKKNPKKNTVMVIEDEILLLQAIVKKLELNNFNIISCTSGKQAIDYLKSLSKTPDVIWLDYYLKDMNGLEFMREIKTNNLWSEIPVVVVSNSASEDKVKNMMAIGAKKYILKAEHRLEDIISTIKIIINEEKVSKN